MTHYRGSLACALALSIGAAVCSFPPAASAATIAGYNPETKQCSVTLTQQEYERLMAAARLYIDRAEQTYYLDYQTFLQAFPQLGDVEKRVNRRILNEELAEYLAPEKFAQEGTVQRRYALEAFAAEGLPESVAHWYLDKHSPARTLPHPAPEEAAHYLTYEKMGREQVLSPDLPPLFAPLDRALDENGVARELQQRFPGLHTVHAKAWAKRLTETFFYTNLHRVELYQRQAKELYQQCQLPPVQQPQAQQPPVDAHSSAVSITVTLMTGLAGIVAAAASTIWSVLVKQMGEQRA